jgi:hypothetical protein
MTLFLTPPASTTIGAVIFLVATLIATTVAAVVLYRLRKDAQWVAAAERHERVDLQYLIKKHVPFDRMTEMPTTELPIAKQNIVRLLRQWTRIFAAATALCLVGGILVTIAIRHELASARIEAARRAAAPPIRAAHVNPLVDIVGTWGSSHDFAWSCAQNPHVISLVDEGRRLVLRFDKSPDRVGVPQVFEFLVVGTQKNEIILSNPDERHQSDALGLPLRLKLILDDKDSYHQVRSDQPTAVYDVVARCPRDKKSGEP